MPRAPTATVSLASPAAAKAKAKAVATTSSSSSSSSSLPTVTTALTLAGLAGAALAGAAGVCYASDACAAAAAGRPLAALWRAGSPKPYTAPDTPTSRFGSAKSAPIPGTPEAEAAAAKAAAEAAAKKPPPPADGPIPGMWVDGGANAPRDPAAPAWPARIRVERSRFFPRKAGALEAAIKELEAEGVATLVDDDPSTPWDMLLPSRVGGLERLRLGHGLHPGQVVATLPELLTNRRSFALRARHAAAVGGRAAAKAVWAATPPVFTLPMDKAGWLDAGNADPASKWIMKASSRGHPAAGHDWGGLRDMAAATMLPVTSYELAQKAVIPPALPMLLGERATLRLFVLITSLHPLRAYVHTASGVVVVRDPAALAAAAARESVRPTFAQWVAPWRAVAPLIAEAGGPTRPGKMMASALSAIATTIPWAALEAPVGDPHGDLQFVKEEAEAEGGGGGGGEGEGTGSNATAAATPLAAGGAWDLLVANVAFDRRYRGKVVDWELAFPARLAADHAIHLAPATALGGADEEVVAALKGAVEVALRRRERRLARAAGACAPRAGGGDDDGGASTVQEGALPPAAWRAGGDPCAAVTEEEWEAAAARGVGYEAVGVGKTKGGGR